VDSPTINVLSVCSGYGGLDLGVEFATGERTRTVCYVEKEAAAAGILAARMEEWQLDPAPVWSDLRTFDGRRWRGCVDLVVAGIPCQPYSAAGKRLGEDDERDLVDDFVALVADVRPALVFVENVPAFVGPWDERGMPGFARLAIGLQRLAYRVEEPCLVAAEDVGAPHRRERAFVLAHAERDRLQGQRQAWPAPRATIGGGAYPPARDDAAGWRRWVAFGGPEPGVRRGANGPARGLDLGRVDRIRACGNGVVPQAAAAAFALLVERAGL
jgi:DNA (cytosine-5)-methyltransferase 1